MNIPLSVDTFGVKVFLPL